MADPGGSSSIFEALRAEALVGANGVLAAAVQSADVIAINATLVDVNAIVVRPGRVTGRTDAVISALPILAGLTLAALVRPLLTLVYVDTILSGRGIQSVTRSADHSGRASVNVFSHITRVIIPIYQQFVPIRSQSVDAHFHSPGAGIRRFLTLVYVHAFAAGAGLEAARTIRPRTGWSQRGRRRRHRRGRRDPHCCRHWRSVRLWSRYARDAIAAVRTQRVSALVAGPAVVATQNTLVVILADLRRGVKSVTGTAGQETDARIAADRVVASLRRQAIVFLQHKTFNR